MIIGEVLVVVDGNIILYTTHCPKCKILSDMLKQKGISFTENDDVQEMINLGFTSAPILNVNGDLMTFNAAMAWIRER